MTIGKDLEQILEDLEAFMIANLNTAIGELNTEKGDEPVLATVDSGAYFFQGMNNKVVNYNPFIFYGVQTLGANPITGATGMRPTVDVIICVSDDGNDGENVHIRMLRYHRVLKDLFEKNFNRVNNRIKLEVGSLDPVSFTIQNSSDNYRAIGVSLTFDIY